MRVKIFDCEMALGLSDLEERINSFLQSPAAAQEFVKHVDAILHASRNEAYDLAKRKELCHHRMVRTE